MSNKSRITSFFFGAILGLGCNLLVPIALGSSVSFLSIILIIIGAIGAITFQFLSYNYHDKHSRRLFFIAVSLVSFIFAGYSLYRIYSLNATIENTSILLSLFLAGLFAILERLSQMFED